jgi:hypothetical protein
MCKIFSTFFILIILDNVSPLLYPFESDTRLRISLNGLWDFKVDFNNEGLTNNWQNYVFRTEVIKVPKIFIH